MVPSTNIDTTKKDILVFVDWYLPGYKGGGPIRSIANMVAHLEDQFKFLIVTRNTDHGESKPYMDIVPDAWIDPVGGIGTKAYHFSKNGLGYKQMKKIILENPDADVYLNSMFSWYFTIIPLIILRKHKRRKVILAPRGMLSPGSFAVKKIKKSIFLFLASIAGIYKNVLFQATSQEEMKHIEAHGLSDAKLIFAPNLHEKNVSFKECDRRKETGKVNLVSIARIAPEKNLLYALRILNKVKGKIRLDIYGSIYDQNYWAKCEDQINTMQDDIVIKYHGDIPVDCIRDVLDENHFLFMPTTGENFGHIILQSLIASCPPIISDKTPWNKLKPSAAGYSISLDDQSAWVEVVETCIAMGDVEYKNMCRQAGIMAKTYVNDPVPLRLNKALFD